MTNNCILIVFIFLFIFILDYQNDNLNCLIRCSILLWFIFLYLNPHYHISKRAIEQSNTNHLPVEVFSKLIFDIVRQI